MAKMKYFSFELKSVSQYMTTCILCLYSVINVTSTEALYPPRLVNQPAKGVHVWSIYRNFELQCKAIGKPEPKYKWIKNGKEFLWQQYRSRIVQPDGAGTLKFRWHETGDAGQYQCFAENDLGTATSNSIFLKESRFADFKDVKALTVSADEGQPFKLTCNPPDGYPTPEISWRMQKLPATIFHIGRPIDSPRITTDPNGNMWFSNVTLSDNSTDYRYICVATSGSSQKFGTPTYLNVSGKAGAAYTRHDEKLLMQFVSKKNTTALVGSTVSLWCIVGGTPLPQIKWTKNGSSLSDDERIHYKNYGKTLVINDTRFSDQGSYECSIGDTFSHFIQLTVYSEPHFTVKPEHSFISTNETIKELACTADGKPVPDIKWTYNGVPLESNAKKEILSNKLVIRDISKADVGNYGCNASNEFGYVYTDIILTLPIPAKIVSQPTDVATFEGRKAVLACIVEGFPDPTFSWSKNGNFLTNGTYSKDYNTLLFLEMLNVSMEDAGVYTCHVWNHFGSDNANVVLHVHEQLKLVVEPTDQQVQSGATVYFHCRSNVNNPVFNLTYTWTKDYEKIDSNHNYPRYIQFQNNTLRISNATQIDSDYYYCNVDARPGQGKYMRSHIFAQAKLSVQQVPVTPVVTHIKCDPTRACIEFWSKREIDYHTLVYQIEFNTSFNPDIWHVAHKRVSANEKRWISLKPWTNYTFRVIAFNKFGASLPSKPSGVCSTEPAVPYRNPDNVRGRGNTSSNMIISWNPIPKSHHNGPNFMYIVEWKPKDNNSSGWNSKNVTDWRIGVYVVENLPSFKEYSIRVRAINEVGEAAALPTVVIGYSGAREPNEKENWTLPLSISLAVVIVLLVIGLILLRRHYRKPLVSQEEADSFYLGITTTEVKDSAYSLPYDKDRFEVDKKSIRFLEDGMLGSGEFGCVCKANFERGSETTVVAVKMANPTKIHRSIINGLLSEIKVLAYLGKHENITELLGANTAEIKQGKVYILLEICPFGSLEKYLRKIRPVDDEQLFKPQSESRDYSNLIDLRLLNSTPLDPSLSQDLIRWSYEICNGMSYLAAKHVVHADLATRNVLLGMNKVAKICDFGLSRRMYNYASYVKSQQEPLPWKWMAPESLRIQEFNEKTDVWAFGVTLWEMYSLGDSPYQGMSWDLSFVAMLQRGFRLSAPEFNDRDMYTVMKRCWNLSPDHRPTFTELVAHLSDLQ